MTRAGALPFPFRPGGVAATVGAMMFRLQYRRYRLPFRLPVRTAHGPWREREGMLLRLENALGQVGYGEAAPIPWFGSETVDEIEAACRELGQTADDARLDAVPGRLGCLKNALTVAREVGVAQTPTPAHLGVAALLPAGRTALAQIAPKAEAGFRVFKWKVGVGDLADELALLDDVCAALPGGGTLRLDANGAWDRRQAERWLERCADRPVEFVEQPCLVPPGETSPGAALRRMDDLLLGLAADFPTPLALDESLTGDREVERWLALGWRGVFVIKPALLGDVKGTLARLAQAKAAVVFSSALETRLGARAALRAAFACAGEVDSTGSTSAAASGPRPARALGFGVWPLFADGRFDGPYTGPFLHWEDVERINPEAVWNALS